MTTKPIIGVAYEDSQAVCMARVYGDGSPLTQADMSGGSIAYRTFDLDDNSEVGSSTPLTIADVIFDTLQTPTLDPRWDVDTVGYNFRFAHPAARRPNGDRFYRMEVTFTPPASDPYPVVFEVESLNLLGS